MKNKLIIYSLLLLVLIPLKGRGQQIILPPTNRVTNSFAIFIDTKSYENCKNEINEYKQQIEEEGLATYLLIADWESPEHVKFFLKKYYNEQALEGAVFIGNIPVPMIRGAQYLTSAFKMDENLDIRESSVPSDRFYDDFDLAFSFIKKDSIQNNLFYYKLSGKGEQRIKCNIYTGRIKPTKQGAEGFRQISEYLKKAVAEHKTANILNKISSYSGEGSFSNSLSAWKDERITLSEQLPSAFKDQGNAKFFIFFMYPYMKETIIKELKREDLDLFLFHEHGMPNRQYLTNGLTAYCDDEYFESGKLSVRNLLRRAAARKENINACKEKIINKYEIDSSWFAGAFDKKVMAEDSIQDLKLGIISEEIPEIAPNPRIVIFDACYNGDFREQDCIANEYIFAKGKTIACFANSVNVLQDKSSSDLLGLIGYGARIGEWAKHINILESHIIGDPTYKFTFNGNIPKIKYNSADTTYWLAILKHNLPIDFKGLALQKLFDLKYKGLSNLLLDTYKKSSSYMLRLQAMHLSAYYFDNNYLELIKLATNDPYEFIRRKSAYYIGQMGRNDMIPYLVDLYLKDYTSERVAFNVIRASGLLNTALFKSDLNNKIKENDFIFNKNEFINNLEQKLNSEDQMRDFCLERIMRKSATASKRLSFISSIKNNPYPQIVDDLLNIVVDKDEDIKVRISLIETLGWYNRSAKRTDIITACKKLLTSNEKLSPEIEEELEKTISRLETFTR